MTMPVLFRTSSRYQWLLVTVMGVGVIAFTCGVASGRAGVALAALDASWLFFAGLAAGALAIVAAVRVAGGGWALAVLPTAEACAAFLTPALVLLVVLVFGAPMLTANLATTPARLAALAARQLVPTALLFVLGRRLATARLRTGDGREGMPLAVGYLVAYALTLSLWAVDWILALSHGPPAAVVPAYYFMGSFLAGLAFTAVVAAASGAGGADLRHDLGKLLFALVIVWSYLLWALFLAAWYAHIPAEMEPLLRRWQGAFRPITAAVILAVFVWPFWLLFSESAKRHRFTLGLGAGMTLAGLCAERFLLVLPSLELSASLPALLVGAGVAAGVAGLFAWSVGPALFAPAAGYAPSTPRRLTQPAPGLDPISRTGPLRD